MNPGEREAITKKFKEFFIEATAVNSSRNINDAEKRRRKNDVFTRMFQFAFTKPEYLLMSKPFRESVRIKAVEFRDSDISTPELKEAAIKIIELIDNLEANPPVSPEVEITEALKQGNTEVLEKRLKTGWNPLFPMSNGVVPIEIAIRAKNQAAIQWLHEHGLKQKYQDILPSGFSPLGLAIQEESPEIITQLIKLGAPWLVRSRTTAYSDGSALEDAINKDKSELLNAMFEGGVSPNSYIRTPIGNQLIIEFAMDRYLMNSFQAILDHPQFKIGTIEECTKNGGYPKTFTDIILKKIGFLAKLPAKDVPVTTIFLPTPEFTGQIPPAGLDQTIQLAHKKEEWDSVAETLFRQIIGDCICAQGVNTNYIKTTFEKPGVIDFVVYIIRQDTGTLVSFAMCKLEKEKTLYVDIICAKNKYKGFGTIMLSKVKELQKFYKRPRLELNSVPEAEGFYAVQQFKRNRAGNKANSGLLHMTFAHPNLAEYNVAEPAAAAAAEAPGPEAGGGAAAAAPPEQEPAGLPPGYSLYYSLPPAPPSPPAKRNKGASVGGKRKTRIHKRKRTHKQTRKRYT